MGTATGTLIKPSSGFLDTFLGVVESLAASGVKVATAIAPVYAAQNAQKTAADEAKAIAALNAQTTAQTSKLNIYLKYGAIAAAGLIGIFIVYKLVKKAV